MRIKDKVSPTKTQELAYEFKVKDAMTAEIISVSPKNTMSDVRKILQNKRISGLPVVERGKLVGIISIENFIDCLMSGRIDEIVENNMTTKIESLYSDEPLIHAISKFDKLGYGRFPVLEHETGKLVGVITKGDIIKCLLKKLEINYHEEEIHRYRASHIFEDIKSDKTTLTLTYKIKGGDYKHAGEQSGYLKINLLRLGIPPAVARRIIVASCEAEMNIIIFTEGGEISASIEEDRIRVNAMDNGPGIEDIEKAMQPGFSTAPDWVREMGFGAGMGLPNIENCADEMKIDSKPGQGTSVEFSVFMKR
ncbi:MAG: CBS domain-containing protein [Candidatus Aminicenantes bacterium]|nr:CBS domain-containing protein [Candidatus Aminicenantes bacterium]NIM80675.1 CBS domain-containing protein [Candidatus Aminicenantes bacterium]NIN20052.1 CBS domain-containing protein [Candidatus Aminicenantes bacterium]NIN43839.1 CBS domain-containing protein [Candidatus Aminicenantes bacterium]NIN86650.1 CBS domain-containing protein [Candidatus Aminicenantes bacterium]